MVSSVSRRGSAVKVTLLAVRYPFSLGDELFAQFIDADAGVYVVKSLGKVTAIRAQTHFFAGGEWHSGFPLWNSRAEAEAYIKEHPYRVPSVR
jgi:hypothetical protein